MAAGSRPNSRLARRGTVLQIPDASLLEPRVGTPLPGPESARLLDRQAEYESNARTYPRKLPIAIRQAEGSFVEDLDGNVFIDCLTGAGSLPLGHSHPEVVAAV